MRIPRWMSTTNVVSQNSIARILMKSFFPKMLEKISIVAQLLSVASSPKEHDGEALGHDDDK